MELCPLECFQILPFLTIFVIDFSEPKKARKLKVHLNKDNDYTYCVYWDRGKGSITRGVMSLGRFKKLKCILLNNFCLWSYFDETYTTLGL